MCINISATLCKAHS